MAAAMRNTASSTGGETDNMRRSQVADGILTGQAHIARQQEQVRNMTNENDQLKQQISTVSGKHYDYVRADKLATLQGEVDALERRYQFEKMRKNDLTKRYQLARIDLLHSRKMKGGVNVEKEQAEAVQRQVDVLENRLDQALGKFNDALSYNKELRDQIDIIRGERRVFQRVYKKMDDDLRAKKRLMAERLEQCNRDIDERDEYTRQAELLKEAIAEQQEEYNERVRSLDSAMMDIKTMREDQNNLQLELEAREYEFEQQLEDVIANPSRNATNAMTAVSRTSEGEDENEPTTNAFHVDKESSTITEIATQIRDATQQDDMDTVRREYLRLRDNNFSLYKYINELTATKETLGDEIRDLKLLLAEENQSENAQRRLIKDLEYQLAATEGKLSQLEDTVGQLRGSMAITMGATEEVYTTIGCPEMEKNPVGKDPSGCTEANVLTYLSAVEERATHILSAFQRHHRMQSKRSDRKRLQPKSAPSHMDDDEEMALTTNTDVTPRGGDLPPALSADDIEVDLTPPLLPTVPNTAHNAVSAQRIVRTADLPCANLGNVESNSVMGDLDDDRVVDHQDIRRLMEQRLQFKLEREERMQRNKRGNSPRAARKNK